MGELITHVDDKHNRLLNNDQRMAALSNCRRRRPDNVQAILSACLLVKIVTPKLQTFLSRPIL